MFFIIFTCELFNIIICFPLRWWKKSLLYYWVYFEWCHIFGHNSGCVINDVLLIINNRIPHPPDVWRAKPVWDSAYEPDALLSTIRPLWALPPLQVIIIHRCRDGRGSLFHGAGREKGSPHSPQCGAGRPSLHGCLIRSLFWHNENLGIFALVIKKPFYRSDIWSQFSKEVI